MSISIVRSRQVRRRFSVFATAMVLLVSSRAAPAQAVGADTANLTRPALDSVPRSMEPAAISRATVKGRVDNELQLSVQQSDRLRRVYNVGWAVVIIGAIVAVVLIVHDISR